MRWEAVDDSSAHATLTDGPLTLKLLFRFNADGLIDTVRAEARGRLVDGKTVTAPWQGRYWSYAMQEACACLKRAKWRGCCQKARSRTGAAGQFRQAMSSRTRPCDEDIWISNARLGILLLSQGG